MNFYLFYFWLLVVHLHIACKIWDWRAKIIVLNYLLCALGSLFKDLLLLVDDWLDLLHILFSRLEVVQFS